MKKKEAVLSNNHYYTPYDLEHLFYYMFSRIDFTVEGLTTDIGCSFSFSPKKEPGIFQGADFEYYEQNEKKIISDVILKIQQDDFENTYNSHDWIKMYKHVFQHTELINYSNPQIMKSWHYFSTYFREACKNDLIGPDEYNLQLKHFISMLILNNSELEARCIHQFLQLASKIYSNEFTIIDSNKVANMLGGVFYGSLKIEGIHRSFKLTDLDRIQQVSYVDNVQKISKILRYIIEDPFFHQDFNKHNYANFLIIGKTSPSSPEESPRIEVALVSEKLPDPSFIKSFKLKNSLGDDDESTLSIEDFKALKISERRRATPECFSQAECGVRVSFSDESLLKRSERISLYNENNLKPERNNGIEKTRSGEFKRKYLSYSRSFDEKSDRVQNRQKDDIESKKAIVYRKSDGERASDSDTKSKNMLFLYSSATTSSNVSPETERRHLRSSKETSPNEADMSPDSGRRPRRLSKEISLSPESGRRKVLSKDNSLSPMIERRKLRSKETSPSPETERRNIVLSNEASLSPNYPRRMRRLSNEISPSPETERRELTFSSGSNSGNTTPEITKRILPEEKKEYPSKGVIFK